MDACFLHYVQNRDARTFLHCTVVFPTKTHWEKMLHSMLQLPMVPSSKPMTFEVEGKGIVTQSQDLLDTQFGTPHISIVHGPSGNSEDPKAAHGAFSSLSAELIANDNELAELIMDAMDKDKSAMLPHNCMDGGTILDAASGNAEIILRQITCGTFTDATMPESTSLLMPAPLLHQCLRGLSPHLCQHLHHCMHQCMHRYFHWYLSQCSCRHDT